MEKTQHLYLRFIAVVCLVFCVSSIRAAAQSEPKSLLAKVLPGFENFIKSDGVVIPYRSLSHTCSPLTPNPKRDCWLGLGPEEWQAKRFLTIYNRDGSIWYHFSVQPSDPDFYRKRPISRKDFVPLGPVPRFNEEGDEILTDSQVFLRLVAEAPNWYEVEVNSESRETKYLDRTDGLWTKVDWSDVFNQSAFVYFDPTSVAVLEKPNGKPATECRANTSTKHTFSKLDGDWMFIDDRIFQASDCRGWVRWRKGQAILIGSILNAEKVPEMEP